MPLYKLIKTARLAQLCSKTNDLAAPASIPRLRPAVFVCMVTARPHAAQTMSILYTGLGFITQRVHIHYWYGIRSQKP